MGLCDLGFRDAREVASRLQAAGKFTLPGRIFPTVRFVPINRCPKHLLLQ